MMNQLEYLGHGLFGLLANRFEDCFYDGGLQSMAQLETAVEDEPHSAERHFALGRRYLQDAKHVMARNAFVSAVKLDPIHAASRVGLACALAHTGKVSEAIDELHACLDAHPDHEPAAMALEFCAHADQDVVQGYRRHLELAEIS